MPIIIPKDHTKVKAFIQSVPKPSNQKLLVRLLVYTLNSNPKTARGIRSNDHLFSRNYSTTR